MCNIDRRLEQENVATLLTIISKAIEVGLTINQPDVLTAATTAYQQGKITKSQFMAVINALDEPTTVQTTAYVQRTGSIIRR